MTSLLDVRLGLQEPTILHLPPDVVSLAAAEEAIELADSYGVCNGFPLSESQRITLRGALGERADKSWAATRVADFGPRQGTGKNDKIAARELAGLVLFGEQLIIHTAHEFPTANESFLRLVAVFENWDVLRRKVARIRYANGEQGIEFLSGQRLKYRARTGGSGRGFAQADLIVYDEAQHLSREHIAASGPAKLAKRNAQTWYAGSGGLTTSVVAWGLRRAALLGTGGRLAYTEATAEVVSVVGTEIQTLAPRPDDLEAWYRAMPGLGDWVTEESMQALYDDLGPELFAREGLCVWDPEPGGGDQIIPADLWSAAGRDGVKPATPVAYAVDVAPDGKWGSVAVSDGETVIVTDNKPGTDWIVDALVDLTAAVKGPVFLDPRSDTNALLLPLAAAGIDAVEVKSSEHAEACGGLLAAVLSGKLIHARHSALDAAVRGATRRPYGDAWAWNRRKSDVDISPLVAVTLARWGALTASEVDVAANIW